MRGDSTCCACSVTKTSSHVSAASSGASGVAISPPAKGMTPQVASHNAIACAGWREALGEHEGLDGAFEVKTHARRETPNAVAT